MTAHYGTSSPYRRVNNSYILLPFSAVLALPCHLCGSTPVATAEWLRQDTRITWRSQFLIAYPV
jgi:hypothetical protein